MYYTNSLLFNAAFGVYIVFKSWTLSSGAKDHFLHHYLADLLAVPVILSILGDGLSMLYRRPIRLPWHIVLASVIYIAVIMEYVAPKYFSLATGDTWDALCYALGGVAFLLYHNSSEKKKSSDNAVTSN